MLRFMLDTNICIYVIKNKPAGIRERFERQAEELCISTITLGELLFGAEKSARPDQNRVGVEEFVGRLEIRPFTASAAAHYGQIRADLGRRGLVAGGHDMLIGGHARSEGLVVVTNNRREFERMSGLLLENWV